MAHDVNNLQQPTLLQTDLAYVYIQLVQLFIIANTPGPYTLTVHKYYDPAQLAIDLIKRTEPSWLDPDLYKSTLVNVLKSGFVDLANGWTYRLAAVVRSGNRLAAQYALNQYCCIEPVLRWQLAAARLNPPRLISAAQYEYELLKMQAWLDYLELVTADYFIQTYGVSCICHTTQIF